MRGEYRKAKIDGIYRASLRGDSTHARAYAEAVAQDLLNGELRPESGKSKLFETRKVVDRGWRAASNMLLAQNRPELATEVRRFLDQMRQPTTEREQIAESLRERAREPRSHEIFTAR